MMRPIRPATAAELRVLRAVVFVAAPRSMIPGELDLLREREQLLRSAAGSPRERRAAAPRSGAVSPETGGRAGVRARSLDCACG